MATLFLLTSPGWLPNAVSIMADVPNLAFWFCALASATWGLESGRKSAAVPVFLFASMAIMTNYFSGLLPFVLILEILHRDRRRIDLIIASLLPYLVLFLFLQQVHSRYGFWPVLESPRPFSIATESASGRSLQAIAEKALYALYGLGIYLLGVSVWDLLIGPHKKPRRSIALILSLGTALLAGWGMSPLSSGLIAGVGAGSAIYLILRLLGAGWSDAWPLWGWAIFTISGYLAMMPFGTARYLLPVWPPLILLLMLRPAGLPTPGSGEEFLGTNDSC